MDCGEVSDDALSMSEVGSAAKAFCKTDTLKASGRI